VNYYGKQKKAGKRTLNLFNMGVNLIFRTATQKYYILNTLNLEEKHQPRQLSPDCKFALSFSAVKQNTSLMDFTLIQK